ncbi:MAG: hypothetical protein HY520_04725 [Candidatus Aenigmarchaeota archaeon]|nr:hypothetical protein [Candidatus Aenigmarchaeota archaeon]
MDRTVLAFACIVILGAAIASATLLSQDQCAALDAAYEQLIARYTSEHSCSVDADCTFAYGRLCQVYAVPASFAREPVQIWSSFPSCSVTAGCMPRGDLQAQCAQDRCQLTP